jgi:hypothetical protein
MRAAAAVEFDRHRRSAYHIPIPKNTIHGIPIIVVCANAKSREETVTDRAIRHCANPLMELAVT